MGLIFIEKLKVEAIIGVYPHERVKKQTLIIDIEIQYDSEKACLSDKLVDAIDYFNITEDIFEYVNNSSFQLIESLTDAIVKRILRINLIDEVKVTVSKPMALSKACNVHFSLIKKKNLKC